MSPMSKRFLSKPRISLLLGLITLISITNLCAVESTTNLRPMEVTIACDQNLTQQNDEYYYSRLLDLVLRKTIPTHGPFKLRFKPKMPLSKRLLREIERGRVDITWMPYSRELSYQLSPIRIRLLKNLSDYRVFLIRSEDQVKFTAVKTLVDLRKLKGGIGAHWPDRQIMEENGLPLVFSMSYDNLFKMLQSNRFDYFSRGIYQVSAEVDTYERHGLALESSLLVKYENPVYFYVHKDNKILAERIETGLTMAMSDGSFNELFKQMDHLRWGEQLLEKENRTIIQLTTF